MERRQLLAFGAALVATAALPPRPAQAAIPLADCLYALLRVQEATRQEGRLISTGVGGSEVGRGPRQRCGPLCSAGLYKDVQRANVKLAVRMMIDNYQLAAAFSNACTYLADPVRQAQAGQLGRATTEGLCRAGPCAL
jgi:hypothetical protein